MEEELRELEAQNAKAAAVAGAAEPPLYKPFTIPGS